MDWSQHSIPAMRLEARFGDRVVPAFCERPEQHLGDDRGGRRAKSRRRGAGLRRAADELARGRRSNRRRSRPGFEKLGLQRGDRVAVLLGNRIEFVLTMFARGACRAW